MSGSSRRTGKQAAINELARLGGIPRPTSPGCTVPSQWLLELTETLFGPQRVDGPISKARILAQLARYAGLDPKILPLDAGATVPGETLWALADPLTTHQKILTQQITFLESYLMHSFPENTSEDRQEALDNLAQLFQELSEHEGDFPADFVGETTIDPVKPDDMDWIQNGWMVTLSTLQGWLRLDDTWDPNSDSAENAALSLFNLLRAENPTECFDMDGEAVAISDTGISLLTNYLKTACAQKQQFLIAIDEGESQKIATRKWLDAWDNLVSFVSDEPLEINASVDTWKIKDFVDFCGARALELNPSYQRDAVWPDNNSQGLIDSILRGIPLPSIILNQRERDGIDIMEIVDGKQRLTAILRFIGRHPDGVRYAQEIGGDTGDEEIRTNYRKWARKHGIKAKEAREKFLPFALAIKDKKDPLYQFNGKYYGEILDKKVRINNKNITIRLIFEGAQKDYLIPVILYSSSAINQIQRVFGLYNSQGKQLNQEELRNAIYHHLDITRLMLILSGDHNQASLNNILKPSIIGTVDISILRSLFNTLNVGLNRFHCSKLTGWAMSFVCYEPRKTSNGEYSLPSTASYINNMLEQINKSKNHKLRKESGLNSLMNDIIGGAKLLLYLHDDQESISAEFTCRKLTGSGEKWDDLPTIAALVSCVFAHISGVSSDTISEEIIEEVKRVTSSSELRPPDKQQTKTQWQYLSKTILMFLKTLNIDTNTLFELLKNRYGSTGLSALLSLNTD